MDKLLKIIVQRLALGFVTLVVVSMIIFLVVEALPGDLAQAILGQTATPENLAAFRKQLGLDLPPHVRYFNWLGNFLQGDLGTSLTTNRPISDLLVIRFANTLFLALYAATVSVPLAVTLGVVAALYRESLFDKFISTATLTTISFPEFFRRLYRNRRPGGESPAIPGNGKCAGGHTVLETDLCDVLASLDPHTWHHRAYDEDDPGIDH